MAGHRGGMAILLAAALMGSRPALAGDAAAVAPRDALTPSFGSFQPHQRCGEAGSACDASSPPAGSPWAWGVIGLEGYLTGDHMAPDGVAFDPLLALTSDFNLRLLPNKELYLFSQSKLWLERAPGTREIDSNVGLAWNYFDALELRASAYSLNNLNRGSSLQKPSGFADGVKLENRYYFGGADIYDLGRLDFVSLGYIPQRDLVGGNGESFHPGLYAQAYLTYDLPTPWFPSYLYGGVQFTGQAAVTPRLLETDLGLALRPFRAAPNLEFRLGYDRTEDVKAHVTRNLVYTSLRIGFGPSDSERGESGGGRDSGCEPSPCSLHADGDPAVWGDVGLPIYAAGNHIAPNGAGFDPLFAATSDFNLRLLANKELYLFWDSKFWAQRPAPGVTNPHQGEFDFSRRELDSELGLAWNFWDSLELRGSAYTLDNLNRGNSEAQGSGGKSGAKLETRYNFGTTDPYDVGKLSFVGLGYIPTGNLVGANGQSFHPGLFAHAYLTQDLPLSWLSSYVYGDVQPIFEHSGALRLLEADIGLAIRPFPRLQNLEFRLGYDGTHDFQAGVTRNLVYGAIRIAY